jgi:hypothetical protein
MFSSVVACCQSSLLLPVANHRHNIFPPDKFPGIFSDMEPFKANKTALNNSSCRGQQLKAAAVVKMDSKCFLSQAFSRKGNSSI